MTLQDIYDQLSYGELRDTFIGKGTDGDGTDRADLKRLFPSVVLSLTDLHTRFMLREGTMLVNIALPQAGYQLFPKFAASNIRSAETNKFIADLDDPFMDNLLQIEKIHGTYQEAEYRIPLNQDNDPLSIRTPTLNSLMIPSDPEKAPWLKETSQLKITYRQDHPLMNIHMANAAPSQVQVELSAMYLEPLLLKMAARVHNPLGADPGALHQGNNFEALYEKKCQQLETKGMEVPNEEMNLRAEMNGW